MKAVVEGRGGSRRGGRHRPAASLPARRGGGGGGGCSSRPRAHSEWIVTPKRGKWRCL
jgi:hypothetical protein